jgi:hypothetical protein
VITLSQFEAFGKCNQLTEELILEKGLEDELALAMKSTGD